MVDKEEKKWRWTKIGIVLVVIFGLAAIALIAIFVLPLAGETISSLWKGIIAPNREVVTLTYFGLISFWIAIKKWGLWVKLVALAILLAIVTRTSGLDLIKIVNASEYQIALIIFTVTSIVVVIIKKIKISSSSKKKVLLDKDSIWKKVIDDEDELTDDEKEFLDGVKSDYDLPKKKVPIVLFSLIIIIAFLAAFLLRGEFLNNRAKTPSLPAEASSIFDASDFSDYVTLISSGSFLVSEEGFVGIFPIPNKIHISKSGNKIFIDFKSEFDYQIQRRFVEKYCSYREEDEFISDPRVWTQQAVLNAGVIFTERGKIDIPDGIEANMGHKSKSKELEISFSISK